MKTVLVIAVNSYREFLRDRMVLVSAFVSFLLIVFSLVLGSVSFGERQRILAHFGLAAIQLSGMGISIFLGSFVLGRELEKQTCLLVLARPVDRTQFILGKFLGIVILTTVVWGLLGAVLMGLLEFSFPIDHFLTVLLGIWLELIILASFAIFCSTFLRPSLSLFACITVFLGGHWIDDVVFFVKKTNMEGFVWSTKVIEKALPNLYQMNWRSVYFLEKGVATGQIAWAVVHSLGWAMLCLSLAAIIFRRKDLV